MATAWDIAFLPIAMRSTQLAPRGPAAYRCKPIPTQPLHAHPYPAAHLLGGPDLACSSSWCRRSFIASRGRRRCSAGVAPVAAAAAMPAPQQRQRGQHPVLETVNDATKWAVSAVAFGTLLWRRDMLAAWCVLGSVVAAVNCRVSGCTHGLAACCRPSVAASHAQHPPRDAPGFLCCTLFAAAWRRLPH